MSGIFNAKDGDISAKNGPTIASAFFSRPLENVDGTSVLVWRDGDTLKGRSAIEFRDEAMWFSMGLATLGISSGERIAIVHENAPEWIIADLAIAAAGCVSVPLYTTLSVEEKAKQMNDSSVTAAVVSARHEKEMVSLKGRMPLLKHIISTASVAAHDGVLTFQDIVRLGRESGSKDMFFTRLSGVSPDDPFTIIYSSGTTGNSKGVVLSHANIISNIKGSLDALDITGRDTYLSYLPMAHVFERMIHHMFVSLGSVISYSKGFASVGADARFFKPSVMVGVPFFFERVREKIIENVAASGAVASRLFNAAMAFGSVLRPLNPLDVFILKKIRDKAAPGLRFFVSGGAALPKELADFYWTLGIPVLQGYGLTETSPVVAVNTLSYNRNGAVGRPIPGVNVRIADDGEILVNGPSVMKGYLNMPEATREAITGGWFHTGDLGEIDADGFLSITGRKKDIIVTSGGKNVAPQKIEALLKADEHIKEALVYGDGKPHLAALVAPEPARLEALMSELGLVDKTSALCDTRVREFFSKIIRKRLSAVSRFEQVRAFALISGEFSFEHGVLTPTMKIKRKKVEEMYGDILCPLFDAHHGEN
ncbi:MAG: long-chain fatty acid--CoA ligase [Deltaproteobacteria bacterium]|nr:long-chain fatty acid--CoA ligase [Deltaproteobacteria bacterium]